MGNMMMVGAAIGFGSGPVLSQLLLLQEFSPETIALYRFAIPALLVLPWLASFRSYPAEYLRCIALGIFSALGMLAFLYSFSWLPATTVILTYYTYPLFAMLIGWAFFGHILTRNRLIAGALIMLAVAIMQKPEAAGHLSWQALLLCFMAPVSYALLINYVARPVQVLKVSERMSAMLAGHLIILVPLSFWQLPVIFIPQSSEQLWLILALGILSAALPQYLFARGTALTGMERSVMISTCEVVFALIFAAVLLQQDVSRLEVIASVLILVSGLIRPEPDQQNSGNSDSQSSPADSLIQLSPSDSLNQLDPADSRTPVVARD